MQIETFLLATMEFPERLTDGVSVYITARSVVLAIPAFSLRTYGVRNKHRFYIIALHTSHHTSHSIPVIAV